MGKGSPPMYNIMEDEVCCLTLVFIRRKSLFHAPRYNEPVWR